MGVTWIVDGLLMFGELQQFAKCAFCFSYTLLHFLQSIISVKLVELQDMWCSISGFSYVGLQVYEAAWSTG